MNWLIENFKFNLNDFYGNKLNLVLLFISLGGLALAAITMILEFKSVHQFIFNIAWISAIVLILRGWYFQIRNLYKKSKRSD